MPAVERLIPEPKQIMYDFAVLIHNGSKHFVPLVWLIIVTSFRKRQFTHYTAICYCHFSELIHPALTAENIVNTCGDFVPSIVISISKNTIKINQKHLFFLSATKNGVKMDQHTSI